MGEAGILLPDERTELIEGEIILMAPIGSRHVASVNTLTEWAILGVHGRAIVSVQNPVRLSQGSEPQPDVALLRPRPDRYHGSLPGPEDVLLMIEVADTSLGYDTDRKLPLYAAAGIPETWIWDINTRRMHVYRAPRGRRYRDVATVDSDGPVSPIAFPDLTLRLAELFG